MADTEIAEHAINDDFDIERTVTGIPAGVTLTEARFMAKINRTDADETVVISKEITTTLDAGTSRA